MKRRIAFTILGIVLVVGVLGGIKGLQIGRMISMAAQYAPPPETVTTFVVHSRSWESLITAVGSLAPVQGVTVTAELPGKVARLEFEPGAKVRKGNLLLEQDTSSEEADLRANEAAVTLAKLNLDRVSKLLERRTVAQSEFDKAEAQYKEAVAGSDAVRALIAKKTIRAPFGGRLGIRLVNLGQMLDAGDPIVSLQSLDPVFVDFLLPQQQLARIQQGLSVRVTTDALPGETVEGKITAINPQVDASTRNIRVQATLPNPAEHLRPGMFVNVALVLPAREEVLPIPATSVLYAPYGDSVFVVEDSKDESGKSSGKVVRQQFVRLGERRGDFVVAASGLEGGESVVSTGVFKLRNGQTVTVDNALSPEFQVAPKPPDT